MNVPLRAYSLQPTSLILSWEKEEEIEVFSFAAANMISGSTYEDDGIAYVVPLLIPGQ